MVESIKAAVTGGASATVRDGVRTEGHFSVDDLATPRTQNAQLSTVAAIGLEGMLALQAVGEPSVRDQAARKRGTAIVAALTTLQRAILASDDPAAALRALTELSSNPPLADDPGLGAALKALVLRSRVEIARRER